MLQINATSNVLLHVNVPIVVDSIQLHIEASLHSKTLQSRPIRPLMKLNAEKKTRVTAKVVRSEVEKTTNLTPLNRQPQLLSANLRSHNPHSRL